MSPRPPRSSTREYLASWLGMLRADAKPLMVAASKVSAGAETCPLLPGRYPEQRRGSDRS